MHFTFTYSIVIICREILQNAFYFHFLLQFITENQKSISQIIRLFSKTKIWGSGQESSLRHYNIYILWHALVRGYILWKLEPFSSIMRTSKGKQNNNGATQESYLLYLLCEILCHYSTFFLFLFVLSCLEKGVNATSEMM